MDEATLGAIRAAVEGREIVLSHEGQEERWVVRRVVWTGEFCRLRLHDGSRYQDLTLRVHTPEAADELVVQKAASMQVEFVERVEDELDEAELESLIGEEV